jgi:tetratricopeptide (TPR) repeat protein
MSILHRLLRGALCVAVLLPGGVFSETLIKPLPVPDSSRIDAAQAKQLSVDRAAFDKVHATLIGPPLAQAYAEIAAAYVRAGFRDIAAVALYDATQVDPGDSRWWYLRGIVARDLKQTAEARADFEAALALDQVYLPIVYRLADTLSDAGDLDAARKLLDKTAREHPDQAVAYAMLGQLSVRQKRYTDAVENLQHALKLEPAANQLYKPLAEAYAAVGNAQAAKDAEGRIGNVTPQLPDPLAIGMYGGPQVSGTPLEQALQLYAIGRIGQARAALAGILGEHPDDIDALALQARLEASTGNFAAAQAAADKALKLAPDNAAALLARGTVYEYAGDDEHAYALYQRAVRGDPKLSLARMLLGNAEMRRARYAQAIEQYRGLVALQPASAPAQARLAAAEVAAGQCPHALADVGAAQERSSKDGDLMQLFVRLASTCASAKPEERDMALDYAQALYSQRGDAGDSAALALALAAHGKFKDAQQYQAEAIFKTVTAGDKAGAEQMRSTQASFVANKVPDRPWPPGDALFKPPMLTPVRPAAPARVPAKQ